MSAPSGGGTAATAESGAAADAAAPQREGGTDAAKAAVPPSGTSGSVVAPTASDPGRLGGTRRVERSAQMTLSTAPDEVRSVSDAVIRTVQGLGGVVASSRIATGDAGGSATFDLRVPTARLERAIADLSKLANVSALTQASDDITGSFVSASARLQDARDERQALLKALGRAKTDRQVSSLRARIADSRRRIAVIEAEVRGLRGPDRPGDDRPGGPGRRHQAGSGQGDGGAWTPGDAARDALRILEVVAGVLVLAAAVMVPAGLLALLAFGAVRATRRRSRLRALDAT